MSNSTKAMRVVRGISQSLCIVILLLSRSQRKTKSIAVGILFWLTVPGRWFRLERRLRHSCEGRLQRQVVQEPKPETSFKEDVAATKRTLLQDGTCILVAHGYGG
jgi:hypothetical protein